MNMTTSAPVDEHAAQRELLEAAKTLVAQMNYWLNLDDLPYLVVEAENRLSTAIENVEFFDAEVNPDLDA